MSKKYIGYLVISSIFIYMFVVYNINFRGPDQPVYYAYTASIVDDGDLNAVNHLDSRYPQFDRFTVSKTYNLPDFHNHGGVVLWAPFYVYAKLIYFLADKLKLTGITGYGFENIAKCVMSLSTVTFAFLAGLFIYLFVKMFSPARAAAYSLTAIFLGTPLFYYVLFEGGNANILACLFAILSVWFCSCTVNFKKIHWFLYGAFFSFCVTLKSELWFQLFFIVPFFIALFLSKRTSWKGAAYFLIGFLPILFMRGVNAYLKYGTVHLEEVIYFVSARFHPGYCFNGLFNPYRGIIYTSPVFYICLLGFALVVFGVLKNMRSPDKDRGAQDLFLLILSSYVILKLFLVGRIFSPAGSGLSMRVFISEVPVLVVLYARAYGHQMKYVKRAILAASVFFILWNLLIVSEHMAGLDWSYITGAPGIAARIGSLRYALYPLLNANNIVLKLKACLPLVAVILAAAYWVAEKFGQPHISSFWRSDHKAASRYLRFFSLLTIYLSIAYCFVTALNLKNNKDNAEKLKKEGFFEASRTTEVSAFKMTGMEEEEFLGDLVDMEGYYALKGNNDMVTYIGECRKELFDKRNRSYVHFPLPTKEYSVLADNYYTEGKYKKAIECYEKVTKLYPYDTDIYISLGDLYAISGDYENAIYTFKKALRNNPDFVTALLRLADIYRKNSRYDEAAGYYRKVIQARPNFADAYLSLGYMYAEQGDYGKAKEYFNGAIRLRPDSAGAYMGLGSAYHRTGDYGKAIDSFRKAVEFDPNAAYAYRNLAEAYGAIGDFKSQMECLQKTIRAGLKTDDVFFSMGNAYNAIGDYDKAIDSFRKAVEFNPNAAHAYRNLAETYGTVGDFNRKIECLQKAIKAGLKTDEVFSSLDNAYHAIGGQDKRIEQAIEPR
ncbi:MAG: tetratricopeptide repeat protein [Candidatus Omnitrophota bacterium]|jgi:tetratricopeptide (TPR) repeat protein